MVPNRSSLRTFTLKVKICPCEVSSRYFLAVYLYITFYIRYVNHEWIFDSTINTKLPLYTFLGEGIFNRYTCLKINLLLNVNNIIAVQCECELQDSCLGAKNVGIIIGFSCYFSKPSYKDVFKRYLIGYEAQETL